MCHPLLYIGHVRHCLEVVHLTAPTSNSYIYQVSNGDNV